MIGNLLGLSAAALALIVAVLYLRLDPEERSSRGRNPALFGMGVAMALAVFALAFPIGAVARVAAWLAVVASGIFIGLRLRND